jgi:hypothetical protein
MQRPFHIGCRDTMTSTENSPHPRTNTSFCTTLQGSKQAIPRPLMLIGSFGNVATRTSLSKINSTLYGECPLVGGDFGPNSLLSGCVGRRQQRVGVYLREETRTYFVLPMKLEVRSLLLQYTSWYVPDTLWFGAHGISSCCTCLHKV